MLLPGSHSFLVLQNVAAKLGEYSVRCPSGTCESPVPPPDAGATKVFRFRVCDAVKPSLSQDAYTRTQMLFSTELEFLGFWRFRIEFRT
jgi:hypothetical protein